MSSNEKTSMKVKVMDRDCGFEFALVLGLGLFSEGKISSVQYVDEKSP